MKKIIIVILSLLLVGCQTPQEKKPNYIYKEGNTIEKRFIVPKGYQRIKGDTMTQFLRDYPLYKEGTPIHLYNGQRKWRQQARMAVMKLPIENYNLQQCADSIMRVYAEYYWKTNQKEKIAFHFVDGFLCRYDMWRKGYRVSFKGKTHYVKTAPYEDSYKNLVKYLRLVFAYASTISLEKESHPVLLQNLKAGDFFIKAGSPGHVVMVVDVCEKNNQKAFLLAQGYMPAQQFHIIKNPRHKEDPWYYQEEVTYPFKTAEYTFEKDSLKGLR